MPSILQELRRRHVFRVAGVYAVVGWLLTQVAGALENAIGLPTWFDGFVVATLLIGFPIALILAWAFEMTPDGVKLTGPAASASNGSSKIKLPDGAIIAGLFGVIAVGAWQQLSEPKIVYVTPDGTSLAVNETSSGTDAGGDEADTSTPETPANAASIAVLPFVALSSDMDDTFFGKGVAEELLNSLAQFPDLKVAARTSAFSFEGQNVDLRQVGTTLGVAHVLEGSVRRSGERLRITAQLIRAEDGFHLWSETYERQLTDIFEIQDEIVGELSRILQFRLGVGAGTGTAARTDVDPRAYEQYLRGLDQWATRGIGQNRELSIRAFLEATEIDPDFADAFAALGVSIALSSVDFNGLDDSLVRAEKSGQAFDRALELDPGNARAHAGLAFWYSNGGLDIKKAQHHAARAIELAPNSSVTHYAVAQMLSTSGDYDAALLSFDRAIALDPLNVTIFRVKKIVEAALGGTEEAIADINACDLCQNSMFVKFAYRNVMALTLDDASLGPYRDELARALKANEIDPYFVEGGESNLLVMNAILGDQGAIEQIIAHPENDRFWESYSSLGLYSGISASLGGDIDFILKILDRGYATKDLFHSTSDSFFIMPNRFEATDSLRRDPRYHEFWARPGLKELAEVRRSNGAEWGLPLPIDGNADE